MTSPALEQFLKGIPLFSLAENSELMDILRLLRPVELTAGQVLFREGEPGLAMWVLSKGVEVSLKGRGPKGAPVAVAYAREGDVVGEMALVDDGARSANAIVVQGGHAHQIDARDFHALRDSFNSAAFKVLRKVCVDLCARLRATNERIVPSGSSSVKTPSLPKGRRPSDADLDGFASFRALPAVVKLALAQKLELLELDSVTPIFADGEDTDGAYFILEGEVSVGRNGKTLAHLEAGTMFGMVSAIDAGKRSASCVTTGPARLFRLKDREFDALFASGHRFAFQMVDLVARQLVGHLRHANAMLPGAGQTAAPSGSVAGPGAPAVASAIESALEEESESVSIELDVDLELEMDSAGLLG